MKTLKLAALGLLLAVPLAAQQPDSAKMKHEGMGMGHDAMMREGGHDMMAGMAEMMAPMMGIMAYAPMHLLDMKTDLNLTPDQVTKLTALQTQAKSVHEGLGAALKPHFDAMNAAFAKGDTGAAKEHFTAAHDAMGKAHASGIGIAAQARAVLTDVQRAQVDQWAKDMGGKMKARTEH